MRGLGGGGGGSGWGGGGHNDFKFGTFILLYVFRVTARQAYGNERVNVLKCQADIIGTRFILHGSRHQQ